MQEDSEKYTTLYLLTEKDVLSSGRIKITRDRFVIHFHPPSPKNTVNLLLHRWDILPLAKLSNLNFIAFCDYICILYYTYTNLYKKYFYFLAQSQISICIVHTLRVCRLCTFLKVLNCLLYHRAASNNNIVHFNKNK